MYETGYTNGIVGSQAVIAAVKKRQKPAMILFWIMSGIFIVSGLIGFITEFYILVGIMLVFLWFFLIPAIIFTVRFCKPMKCKPLKNHPALLKQADWLFANVMFQNDVLVVSQNFFASKKDPSALVPTQEVLLVYKRTVTTNFSTMYFMVIETVRETVSIQYLKKQEPQVEQGVQVIAPLCPHIRIGHTQENLTYVDYMKAMWEQTQKNQGMM